MRAATFAACLGLAACQSAPPDIVWSRADGQKIAGHQTLIQQFQLDTAVCRGRVNQSSLFAPRAQRTGDVYADLGASLAQGQNNQTAFAAIYEGCMAERGYLAHIDDHTRPTAQIP